MYIHFDCCSRAHDTEQSEWNASLAPTHAFLPMCVCVCVCGLWFCCCCSPPPLPNPAHPLLVFISPHHWAAALTFNHPLNNILRLVSSSSSLNARSFVVTLHIQHTQLACLVDDDDGMARSAFRFVVVVVVVVYAPRVLSLSVVCLCCCCCRLGVYAATHNRLKQSRLASQPAHTFLTSPLFFHSTETVVHHLVG